MELTAFAVGEVTLKDFFSCIHWNSIVWGIEHLIETTIHPSGVISLSLYKALLVFLVGVACLGTPAKSGKVRR